MNLDKFDSQCKILINAAYNYASENKHQCFMPIHLLKVLLESSEKIKLLIKEFSVDSFKLSNMVLFEMENLEKSAANNDFTNIQSNLLLLIEQAANEIKKFKIEKVDANIIFLSLCLDISSKTKDILQTFGITYDKMTSHLKSFYFDRGHQKNEKFELLNKYTINLIELAKHNKIDPIIGRENEIKRTIQVLSRRTKNNPILIGDPGVGKTAIAEGISIKIVESQVPSGLTNFTLVTLSLPALMSGTKYRGEFEDRLKNLINEIDLHKKIILFIDEIHTIIGTGSNEGGLDIANILKPALARGSLRCIGATTLVEYRKYFEKDAALARRFQPIHINEPSIEDTISILRGLKEKYEIHHGTSISDSAVVSAAKLSSRYIVNRKLPDKAIDLIDEAASKKNIELTSKPYEVENLENQLLKNKIEIESLVKEATNNKSRISEIKRQDLYLNEKLKKLKNNWNLYKEKIEKLNTLKENLEKSKLEFSVAKRLGKLTDAGKIKHSVIPNLIDQIKELEIINKDILGDKKVTGSDIANIISSWTGVPINKILETEKEALLNLEKLLHERIIAQDKAINAVASVIKRARTGINDPKKPIGSFLFLGPTGVGKTEMAKTLAAYLLNDEKELLTFDMSEFTEKHSVSKLIGSPPGYIGFEDGGRLTKAVRERPYRVILFDEIEKAHPEIFNVFLQILDEGRLTDNQGNNANFKNTILILTSNLGSELLIKEKENNNQQIVLNNLKQYFKPEFLNRLDDIIIFNKLNKKQMFEIVNKELLILKSRLKDKKIQINICDSVKKYLLEKGSNMDYGARPLKRIIEKEIGGLIADEIIKNNIKKQDQIKLTRHNDNFEIIKISL